MQASEAEVRLRKVQRKRKNFRSLWRYNLRWVISRAIKRGEARMQARRTMQRRKKIARKKNVRLKFKKFLGLVSKILKRIVGALKDAAKLPAKHLYSRRTETNKQQNETRHIANIKETTKKLHIKKENAGIAATMPAWYPTSIKPMPGYFNLSCRTTNRPILRRYSTLRQTAQGNQYPHKELETRKETRKVRRSFYARITRNARKKSLQAFQAQNAKKDSNSMPLQVQNARKGRNSMFLQASLHRNQKQKTRKKRKAKKFDAFDVRGFHFTKIRLPLRLGARLLTATRRKAYNFPFKNKFVLAKSYLRILALLKEHQIPVKLQLFTLQSLKQILLGFFRFTLRSFTRNFERLLNLLLMRERTIIKTNIFSSRFLFKHRFLLFFAASAAILVAIRSFIYSPVRVSFYGRQ